MKKVFFLISFLLNAYVNCIENNVDLSIVGFIDSADGIGRIPITIIDCLKNKLNINFVSTRCINPHTLETSNEIKKIINKKNEIAGNVALFSDILNFPDADHYKAIPANSIIKIAYSMIEGTTFPNEWVEILNSKFDAVVVPDSWLIDIYRNSGVNIPIFCLPIILYLEDFLKLPPKKRANNPFIFGNTNAFVLRKNHIKLIQAFAKAFKNRPDVELYLSGRVSRQDSLQLVQDKIKELNLKNVILKLQILSQKEYVNLMSSFDCFVSLSTGEGFAVPPREALASGLPLIITNNTVHKTICKNDFVKCIPANIIIPGTYFGFPDNEKGYAFDCDIDDATNALNEIYKNYQLHLNKAQKGREWTKQYLKENLKEKYLNLIKPIRIFLGPDNIVTDDYLMTNSISLYQKYLKLIYKNYIDHVNNNYVKNNNYCNYYNYLFLNHYLNFNFKI